MPPSENLIHSQNPTTSRQHRGGCCVAHRTSPHLEAHGGIDGLHPLLERVGHVRAERDGDTVQQVLTQRALLRVVRGNQQRPAAAASHPANQPAMRTINLSLVQVEG
jgi:hypothetical protein